MKLYSYKIYYNDLKGHRRSYKTPFFLNIIFNDLALSKLYINANKNLSRVLEGSIR